MPPQLPIARYTLVVSAPPSYTDDVMYAVQEAAEETLGAIQTLMAEQLRHFPGVKVSVTT